MNETNEILDMRADQFMIDGLVQLVENIRRHNASSSKLCMIEIGSYSGQSMEIFAHTGHMHTIACIDPWQPGYDTSDIASSSDMTAVEAAFDKRMQQVVNSGTAVLKHKGTVDSFAASDCFKRMQGTIDFAYIDGCHTYEAVKHDIQMCINAIKPNVAICGHDIHHPPIVKAVQELLGNPDIRFGDGSYIKFLR